MANSLLAMTKKVAVRNFQVLLVEEQKYLARPFRFFRNFAKVSVAESQRATVIIGGGESL